MKNGNPVFQTIERDELPLLVYNVGHRKCQPENGWGPAVRDHYLLHYTVSGQGKYFAKGLKVSLLPGDAFLIPPEVPVRYQADAKSVWEYYWVGFSGKSVLDFLQEIPSLDRQAVLHPEDSEQFCQTLHGILKAHGSHYANLVCTSGFLQAALSMLMEPPPPRRNALSVYAQQGASFLRQNYFRSISVEEAAQQTGVSRSCLCRAFQAEFGCSPSTYLSRCRIQRAKDMLRTTTHPVSIVAASVGFEDPFYFSRVFKHITSCTPTDYREGKK